MVLLLVGLLRAGRRKLPTACQRRTSLGLGDDTGSTIRPSVSATGRFGQPAKPRRIHPRGATVEPDSVRRVARATPKGLFPTWPKPPSTSGRVRPGRGLGFEGICCADRRFLGLRAEVGRQASKVPSAWRGGGPDPGGHARVLAGASDPAPDGGRDLLRRVGDHRCRSPRHKRPTPTREGDRERSAGSRELVVAGDHRRGGPTLDGSTRSRCRFASRAAGSRLTWGGRTERVYRRDCSRTLRNRSGPSRELAGSLEGRDRRSGRALRADR